MNKLFAEQRSHNLKIVNGEVIDDDSSMLRIKNNDEHDDKFDVDLIKNDKGVLMRELTKKEIKRFLKPKKSKKYRSLIDKLTNFSIHDPLFLINKKSKKKKSKKKQGGKQKTRRKYK